MSIKSQYDFGHNGNEDLLKAFFTGNKRGAQTHKQYNADTAGRHKYGGHYWRKNTLHSKGQSNYII